MPHSALHHTISVTTINIHRATTLKLHYDGVCYVLESLTMRSCVKSSIEGSVYVHSSDCGLCGIHFEKLCSPASG